SEALAVVADPGTRRADDRHYVADRWQEAADLCKGKYTRGAAAITSRSKRNEDCRSSESNPRAPARAARCAECTGAAEPVPGQCNSRPATGANELFAQQCGRRTH